MHKPKTASLVNFVSQRGHVPMRKRQFNYDSMQMAMEKCERDLEAFTKSVCGKHAPEWTATCAIWLDAEARRDERIGKAWLRRDIDQAGFRRTVNRLRTKFSKAAAILGTPALTSR